MPDSVLSAAREQLSGGLVRPVVFAAVGIVALCLAGGQQSRSFCENSAL